ncbi:MAG: methylenetetrahydrofolate reductase [NAD(P)H] [Ruminococcaceae bacterium]|jgi:methylenetetrahydrofolate reductase (NADPH)|nr:methylenetetrahydrofolate reductase [NAD(P)H] [Oscillospiraceae bacterium]
MRISDIFSAKTPVSFEIFPPKGDLSVDSLRDTLSALKQLNPDYISVTYSAGGTGNSEKTVELASVVKNEFGIEAMAHLTCINSDKERVRQAVSKIRDNGIENVLALRGDIIEGNTPTDFKTAADLIEEIKNEPLCIGAACYPEGHVTCESVEKDIEYLKAKQDKGASFFVSQLFFENRAFYEFIEKAKKAGISVPVTAGIMPMLSKAQVSRMIFMCGASLPSEIIRILNKYESDAESLKMAGIEYAAKQANDLIENGVDGIHLYTMNKPEIAMGIMERIK